MITIDILLVEDNQDIANVYRAEFESKGGRVVTANDYNSAIAVLNSNEKSKFDLLFTDIDLVGDVNQGADRSGLEVASFTHQNHPGTRIVGHSAIFDDEDIEVGEISYFDHWFPKAVKVADRDVMLEAALEIGITGRAARKFIEHEEILKIPQDEKDFISSGYKKINVIPPEGYKSFSIWEKGSNEGCELEVVDCPPLIAWGADFEEAREHLFRLIDKNKENFLSSLKKLRGPSLQVAEFIKEIEL